jgi:hypothetical protein
MVHLSIAGQFHTAAGDVTGHVEKGATGSERRAPEPGQGIFGSDPELSHDHAGRLVDRLHVNESGLDLGYDRILTDLGLSGDDQV